MILQDGSVEFEESRALSKLLLGNSDRLVVAAAVGEADQPIWARQVAEALRIADNRVGLQLAVFEKAGLMRKLPPIESDRRQYYERLPSPYWELACRLCEEIVDEVEARTRP